YFRRKRRLFERRHHHAFAEFPEFATLRAGARVIRLCLRNRREVPSRDQLFPDLLSLRQRLLVSQLRLAGSSLHWGPLHANENVTGLQDLVFILVVVVVFLDRSVVHLESILNFSEHRRREDRIALVVERRLHLGVLVKLFLRGLSGEHLNLHQLLGKRALAWATGVGPVLFRKSFSQGVKFSFRDLSLADRENDLGRFGGGGRRRGRRRRRAAERHSLNLCKCSNSV